MKTVQLKQKIKNGENLGAIIRTMKALAGVSIHHYEKSRSSLEEYSSIIETALHGLLSRSKFHFSRSAGGENGMIVIGSDHGLCGAFNEQICNYAENIYNNKGGRVISIGERAVSEMMDRKIKSEYSSLLPSSLKGTGSLVSNILSHIQIWQEKGITEILLVCNTPLKNSYTQKQKIIYPPSRAWLNHLQKKKWNGRTLPYFTSSPPELFSGLIREYIHISLLQGIMESQTAENAARLATMQRAEKNLEESLAKSINDFRQERQKNITDELLDIVSGYEIILEKGKHMK